MKAKKIISVLLIGTAVMSLSAGCGSNTETETTKTPKAQDSAGTDETTAGGGTAL